jgi:hypothetical protein
MLFALTAVVKHLIEFNCALKLISEATKRFRSYFWMLLLFWLILVAAKKSGNDL